MSNEKLAEHMQLLVDQGGWAKDIKPTLQVEVSSGGTRASAKEPHPALWSTMDEAIFWWHKIAYSTILENTSVAGCRWTWLRIPAIEAHQITEMVHNSGHRIVQDRYAISSLLGIEVNDA